MWFDGFGSFGIGGHGSVEGWRCVGLSMRGSKDCAMCCVDVDGYMYAKVTESVMCSRSMFALESFCIIVSPCLSAVHEHFLLINHVLTQATMEYRASNDRYIYQTILRRSKCHFIEMSEHCILP
jgi:hypothetical protein